MATKQKKRKVKRNVKVKQKASLTKKDSTKVSGVAPTKTIYTDNGATFKVKLRKKKQ